MPPPSGYPHHHHRTNSANILHSHNFCNVGVLVKFYLLCFLNKWEWKTMTIPKYHFKFCNLSIGVPVLSSSQFSRFDRGKIRIMATRAGSCITESLRLQQPSFTKSTRRESCSLTRSQYNLLRSNYSKSMSFQSKGSLSLYNRSSNMHTRTHSSTQTRITKTILKLDKLKWAVRGHLHTGIIHQVQLRIAHNCKIIHRKMINVAKAWTS